MSINIYMDLIYFFFLLVKHAIIDVGVQKHLGWMGKEHYWRKQPHLHYAGHGIGTMLVLLPTGIVPAIIAGVLDWWCHWQIDFSKAKLNNVLKIDQSSNTYWWLLTIDQLLHYTTYLVIVVLFV